jgi:hypothetical protein
METSIFCVQTRKHAVAHYFSSEECTRVNYLIPSGVPMTPWLHKSVQASPAQWHVQASSYLQKNEKSTYVWQGGPRK